MPDRLFAIRDKLDRADEQLDVVKTMARDYLGSTNYEFGGKYDPDAHALNIAHRVAIDVRLPIVVGEIVYDLRSALDHLAWQFVLEDGGTPDEGPHGTCFPILKAPPQVDANGVVLPIAIPGGVDAPALALITWAQPYQFVDPCFVEADSLWILHRLSIVDKHRHIPIEALIFENISFGSGSPFPRFSWHTELVSADEHSAEVRIVPDDPAVDVDGTASIKLVFHEPVAVRPALSSLWTIARRVREIVDEAARTCFA